jgi:glyoxylase-like metal-dependent hydrolase (beta-lactamase superfamily II)
MRVGDTLSMRVRCVSTGVVRPKRGERGLRRYAPGGWSDDALPINSFVIEHPAGICLFDAGQTARAASWGHLPRWHPLHRLCRFELEQKDEVASQLGKMGIEPGEVRWVVLSHLHTDHVGGLAPFAGAEVLVTRTEWDRASGLAGQLRGYLPQHWPRGLDPRLVDFAGLSLGPFPASLDLAGDGRLVLVPTPGHTPGHLSLLVRTDDRAYLCLGDVAHTAAELPRVQPELAEFCRREQIVVLAAHDPGAPGLLRARSTVEEGRR